MSEMMRDEIVNRFTYHAPTDIQIPKYRMIRAAAAEMAAIVTKFTPSSREQSIALTKLDEAVMWANAAIARNSR